MERGHGVIFPDPRTPLGGDRRERVAQGGGGGDRAGVWRVYEQASHVCCTCGGPRGPARVEDQDGHAGRRHVRVGCVGCGR